MSSAADGSALEDYARLSDQDFRREIERRGAFFVAEGELVIRSLIETRDRWRVMSALVTPALRERLADALALLDPLVPIYVRPLDELRAITGFNVHRGALALAVRGEPLSLTSVVGSGSARRLVVVEAVNDHENLGAIFRNAAAFGIDGIVLDAQTCDPLYRRALRVSMGHVLRVPFARSSTWIDDLHEAGWSLVALTPAPDAEPIDSFVSSVVPDERLAIVVGAERAGLAHRTLSAADHRVRIPMATGVDSLNVAVAAAVALHALRC